jgi:hypothetical protein
MTGPLAVPFTPLKLTSFLDLYTKIDAGPSVTGGEVPVPKEVASVNSEQPF